MSVDDAEARTGLDFFKGLENEDDLERSAASADWPHDAQTPQEPRPTDPPPVAVPAGVTIARLRILACLPNPIGADQDNEVIVIANPTADDVSLARWSIKDRLGSAFPLPDEQLASNGVKAFKISHNQLPLTNGDNKLMLVDNMVAVVHTVEYTGDETGQGSFITFD